MKVLIVDDSPIIRERLAEIIASLPGVEVIGGARNAREGLEMADTLKPDLVTLDLHMSGGDGFEFLERVQLLETPPQVSVLTNYSNEQYRRRCLALGAVAFLDKSAQFEELGDLIRTLRRPPGAVVGESS